MTMKIKTAATLAGVVALAALTGCSQTAPAGGGEYALKQKPAATKTVAAKDCSQFKDNRDGINRGLDVADIPVGVGNMLSAVGVSNRVASVGWRAKRVGWGAKRVNNGTRALSGC